MNLRENRIYNYIFSKSFLLRASILAGSFLIFMFLMDSVFMPLYTKHGKEYDLPDVTEKSLKEGMEILDSEGFQPIVKDSIYDEQYPPGAIVQQNPLPFSRVKKGRRVYLVVSIGDKPRYMPRLIDSTPQDANFLLKEAGLDLNQTIYEFSDYYFRGVVMNQSVPPGDVVKKNQKINITVSLGPPPTSLEIPNMVGKSLENARKELDAIGVKLGRIKYSYRPNLVPGTVLNQSISAGHSAVKIDSLSLMVSTDQPPATEETNDSTQKGF